MIRTCTLHARFDGNVLKQEGGRSIWDVLDEFTGKVEGPKDWSENHDNYLYGVPKKVEQYDCCKSVFDEYNLFVDDVQLI